MSQALDVCLSPKPISLLGTIMITGTIMLSVAGFQGSTGQNTALGTFSQKGTSNFRTMGSTKSRLISESGSAYLMEDTKETNRKHGYLPQLGSIINIIAEYPSLEIVENNPQIGKYLSEISMYEILSNGSMISMTQCLTCSFGAGTAYNASGYTDLGFYENSVVPIADGLEVMIMTEQFKQLSLDLRELDKKLDGKMDSFDKKLDTRFDKLEAKIDKAVTELTALSNKLSDKVGVIRDDVLVIKTSIDASKTWKEKLQIPLFVGLVVAATTAILRVLIP